MTPTTHSELITGKANTTRSSRMRLAGAALLLALLVFAGVWPRLGRNREAVAIAKAAGVAMPSVLVTKERAPLGNAELLLPGNTEAVNVASIYARANGYVKERMVDIGSVVKAGQTLAVIESPEVDQELAQARAALQADQSRTGAGAANLEQSKAGVNQATRQCGAGQGKRRNRRYYGPALEPARGTRSASQAIGRRAPQRLSGPAGGIGGGARRPAHLRGQRSFENRGSRRRSSEYGRPDGKCPPPAAGPGLPARTGSLRWRGHRTQDRAWRSGGRGQRRRA